jgi:hypothetical protein
VFALVGRSQHCFVELLLGGEEHALARALLVLVLLVRVSFRTSSPRAVLVRALLELRRASGDWRS